MDFVLTSTTARAARAEIASRWPDKAVNYTGYDQDGNDVLLGLVRERGNKALVAIARRNRSKRPIRFVAHINS